MNNELPYFYDTQVEWKGARKGELRALHLPSLEIAAPPEFKGHENIWTPEHLYVASVNVCFMTTFLAIAELSKLDFTSFTCNASGKLEKIEGEGFKVTEITLHPKLVIRQSRDLERAGRILEKAERNCLISNSINTIVKLEPEIAFEEMKEQVVASGS
ncbi:MAG: OsmC family protein [Acidobacteriota bacterium]